MGMPSRFHGKFGLSEKNSALLFGTTDERFHSELQLNILITVMRYNCFMGALFISRMCEISFLCFEFIIFL